VNGLRGIETMGNNFFYLFKTSKYPPPPPPRTYPLQSLSSMALLM